jgi:hypothetical protein
MPIDRNLWAEWFAELPRWQCPKCEHGYLRPLSDTVEKRETGESEREHDDPDWELQWVRQRFVGLMKCDSESCGEIVSVGGDIWGEEMEHETHGSVWVEGYQVRWVYPPVVPFRTRQFPSAVTENIRRAAGLMWYDPEAAANKLRQAVELLLTNQGIRRTVITKKKRRVPLPLHDRVVEYGKRGATQKERADYMLAVKWIGNVGSHVGQVTRSHVLDGFDMMNVVLDDIFLGTRAELQRRAAEINRRRTPAGPRRRRNK